MDLIVLHKLGFLIEMETIKSVDKMDKVYKLVFKPTHKSLSYEPLVQDETLSSSRPLKFSKDRKKFRPVIKDRGAFQMKK